MGFMSWKMKYNCCCKTNSFYLKIISWHIFADLNRLKNNLY